MDVRPLKIPDEDPLEVRLVANDVVWKEFKPCPNMFPHANGKILDDEIVIIHSSGSTVEPEVFEPNVWVRLPSVLVMLEGGRKRCGNDALRMRRLKARGLGPSGLGLLSSGQQLCLGRVSPLPSMVRPGSVSPAAVWRTSLSCRA